MMTSIDRRQTIRDRLRQAVGELGRDRTLLLLRYADGLTDAEIAAAIDTTEADVHDRLAETIHRLRHDLMVAANTERQDCSQ